MDNVTVAGGHAAGELMHPWEYHMAALVLFLIGFFGFTLNLFVIILMCKDVKLWTPMNIILFNLVCSDFLVSICGNPLTLTAALSHRWIFGRTLCIAYGFFMALFGITSITTLTVLSYERYCLVVFPLSIRKISNRGAVISIVFIWLYSLALTMPPLFGWGQYINEAANISCSVNWETRTYNATSYIVFLFAFGLIVPVTVITYSYVNIIRTMKKNALKLGRTRNRAEKRVTIMVAVMITAFLIAWTPYSIFALIEQFGPSDFITPRMAVLPALIAKSSICYNPLIYVGLNTQFRASMKRHVIKESTVIETTVNQISQTDDSNNESTINCSLNFVRQGKDILLKTRKPPTNNRQMSTNDTTNNDSGNCMQAIQEKSENVTNDAAIADDDALSTKSNGGAVVGHEMAVFVDGRRLILRTNSYQSNIC